MWCFQGQGKSRPRPQAGYFPDFTLYYLKGQWMNECIDLTPKSSHTFRMQRANTTGDPQNPKTLTIYWRVITCNFISVPCCNPKCSASKKIHTQNITEQLVKTHFLLWELARYFSFPYTFSSSWIQERGRVFFGCMWTCLFILFSFINK